LLIFLCLLCGKCGILLRVPECVHLYPVSPGGSIEAGTGLMAASSQDAVLICGRQ
jgi:hypothetical protein